MPPGPHPITATVGGAGVDGTFIVSSAASPIRNVELFVSFQFVRVYF